MITDFQKRKIRIKNAHKVSFIKKMFQHFKSTSTFKLIA